MRESTSPDPASGAPDAREPGLDLNELPAIICYLDREQRYRTVNRSYCLWVAKPPQDIIGRTLREVVGEPHASIAQPYIERVLAGEPVSFESRVLRPDGTLKHALVSYTPDRHPDGAVAGFVGLVSDISRQHRAEEEARRGADRLRAVADAVPALISFINSDYRYEFVNAAYGEWFAIPPAEAQGRHVSEVLGEKAFRTLKPYFDRALAGETVRFEGWTPYQNGARYVSAFYRPHADDFGRITGFSVLVEDVTHRRRIEQELRQTASALKDSEGQMRSIADSIPQLAWMADGPGRFLWYSRQWLEFAGPLVPVAGGWDWMTLLPPDHEHRVRSAFSACVAAGTPWEDTFPLLAANGASRWFLSRALPLHDADGQVSRWFGTSTDITEQLEANRRIEELNRDLQRRVKEFETLVRVLPIGVGIGLDPECRDIRINDAFAKLLGMPPGVNASKSAEHGPTLPFRVFKDGVELSADQLPMQAAAREGREIHNLEMELERADGARITYLAFANPLFDEHGRVRGALGAFLDISERKRAEEELRKKNHELEEFAYVVSHDVREPLRMVNAYSQLIVRRVQAGQYEDIPRLLTFIEGGVTRMESMIRDLLDYSRLVHAETARFRPLPLAECVEVAMANLADVIHSTHARICVGSLPIVLGDRTQLFQVFQNLLSNSLKYARAGQRPLVEITAEVENDQWVVCVRDNGIGFDQDYAERIFGLFKRLHRDEYPGTGLGLTICRRVVERHGGRIWAAGRPDEGAAFYFTLPVMAAATAGP
ncbi:MAG: PAS domain-containing protein [Bryobacteraceae bacterium]|nr:PAS domain-containing protein [Bryobacteraceae bacterium]